MSKPKDNPAVICFQLLHQESVSVNLYDTEVELRGSGKQETNSIMCILRIQSPVQIWNKVQCAYIIVYDPPKS